MANDFDEEFRKRSEKIHFKTKGNVKVFADVKHYHIESDYYRIKIEEFKNAKRFKLHPFFQREYVWDDKKASELIETILMNMIIPTIYSYINLGTGDELIIDGQQRLTSIKKFLNKSFKLRGLQIYGFLNDLYFDELPDVYKNQILNYSIEIFCIKNISSKEVIFDMFKRFNGGVVLNAQEIRNCIYSGKYNDFIKLNLSKYKHFDTILQKINTKRLLKEELAVRFLALYENLNSYTGNMNAFINKHYESKIFLNDLNMIELKDKFKEDDNIFKKAVDACLTVFGTNAFKTITRPEEGINKGKITYASFNKYVYDMQMLGFADFDLDLIKRNSDKIKTKYEEFVLNNPDLAPTYKNTKNTSIRIKKWQECIYQILQD